MIDLQLTPALQHTPLRDCPRLHVTVTSTVLTMVTIVQ